MMAVGIATPERRAVPPAERFFAGVGNQCQFTIEHPDEFVLMAVPMTLAGPGSVLDDFYVHAELRQPRKTCQPPAGLSAAGLIEGTGIGTTTLRRHNAKVDFLHRAEHLKLRPTVRAGRRVPSGAWRWPHTR